MKAKVFNFLNVSALGSIFITVFILASVVIFSLETEYPDFKLLPRLDVAIAIIFMIEYFARIWSADYRQSNSIKARLAYIFSLYGLLDLIAFLPVLLFPAINGSTLIRLIRLTRLVKIMKIKTITRALRRVTQALRNSYNELAISFSVSLALIFLGAVLMYVVEGKTQPEAFGSVPRALWWSMATLTTVGYGDVYPITLFGKVLAALMALIGIAAVAMPAGILAAAFMKD